MAAKLPEEATPGRLELLFRGGLILFHLGRLDEAEAHAEELFTLARRDRRQAAEGNARRLFAALRLRKSRMTDAWEQASAARRLFADLGDEVKEALVLELMGVIKAYGADHREAAHWHGLAVQMYRRSGRRHELPRALGNLARDLLHLGDDVQARRLAEDALAIAHQQGALRQELETRTLIGTIALSEGRTEDAITAYRRAVGQARSQSLAVLVGTADACLAIALLVRGSLDEARESIGRAIEVYAAAGDRLGLSNHYATACAIEARDGDVAAAADMLGRSEEAATNLARPDVWITICGGFLHAARAAAGQDPDA
jgi:tetratricopeptide (TPR) repeat protein